MSLKLIEEAVEKIATESTGEYLRDVLFAKDKKERKAAHARFGQKSEHSTGLRAGVGAAGGAILGGLAGLRVGHPGKGALIGAGTVGGLSAASSAIRNAAIRNAREKAE
jgi:uncharacterized protein YcfJ